MDSKTQKINEHKMGKSNQLFMGMSIVLESQGTSSLWE